MSLILASLFPVASLPLVFAQAQPNEPFKMVLFIGALFAVMYFVMIRPQQKQAKQQRDMLAALKRGDEVVTQGGVLGKVFMVSDKVVTLEIANNVRMRVLKTAIQGKVNVTEIQGKVNVTDEEANKAPVPSLSATAGEEKKKEER